MRRALGRPDRIVRSTPNGYRDYAEYVWGFDPELRVGLYGRGTRARVALATTRRERTRSGAGVGSTHRTLRRVLGARCYVAYEAHIASPLGQRILGAAEPRRGPWVPVRG